MRVILINPKFGKNRSAYSSQQAPREPLGILAVGTYLEHQGFDVELIDAILYSEESIKNRIKRLLDSGPSCFGFSVMTAQTSHALEISEFIKSLDRSVPIIWGGVHPTLFPAQTSRDPNIDFVVYGPGEATCLELMHRLSNVEAERQFENIEGIAYKGYVTPPRKRDDINRYPFLNYDLLDLAHYLGPAPHHLFGNSPIRALNLLSSRGCPWRCAFCINRVTKNFWRPFSAERFLDELEYQVSKYQLDAVRFSMRISSLTTNG